MRSSPDAIKALTQSLARPVSRGLLPAAHAYAAIVTAVARATAAGDDLEGLVAFWWFILGEQVYALSGRRDVVVHKICRAIKPMILRQQRSNAMRAEAHEINGATGFLLTETEVDVVVADEILPTLPPAPRRPFHGR